MGTSVEPVAGDSSSRYWTWLSHPLTFTISVPLMTVAGAMTAIAAPMLLDPASFGQFAILATLFQYVSDFDLGLSRLSDRVLTRHDTDVGETTHVLLAARVSVALLLCVVAGFAGAFGGALMAFATFAGVCSMLSNGPIAIYRARSEIARFTIASICNQFGMSIPRFTGLLLGGVEGCILSFVLWYGGAAVILYAPFAASLHRMHRRQLFKIITEALPLFVLGSAWLLYLLANRWISGWISSPVEAGLFAFGANLCAIGIAVVATVSQTYYPRHLVRANPGTLFGQLAFLLGTVTFGCLIAIVLCRFEISWLFPRFRSAGASASAVLFSGVVLSQCAWLYPLVIARAEHPVRQALVIFGSGLASMFGCMSVMNAYAGIEGQAWACVPPAFVIFGFMLRSTARANMLTFRAAWALWWSNLLVQGGCFVAWYGMFY